MKIFKKMGKYLLVEACFYLIIGICLLFAPNTTMTTIIYLIALFLAIHGIVNIVSFVRMKDELSFLNSFVLSGILELLLSLILFRFHTYVSLLLPLIIGIIVVMSSCINILYALEIRKEVDRWLWILIYGIICSFAGILIIINPFSGLQIVSMFCGVLMLIRCFGNIWIYIVFKKFKKSLS